MKMLLLILCLAVIYAFSGIYAQEDVNLTEDGDANYNSNYSTLSWERSLSRHRRAMLSWFSFPILKLLRNPVWFVIETAWDLSNYFYNVLLGHVVCPKVEKLSLDSVEKLDLIKTVKTIGCSIYLKMSSENRALILEFLRMLEILVKETLLPILCTMLKLLRENFALPLSIRGMIDALYIVLTLMRYVK